MPPFIVDISAGSVSLGSAHCGGRHRGPLPLSGGGPWPIRPLVVQVDISAISLVAALDLRIGNSLTHLVVLVVSEYIVLSIDPKMVKSMKKPAAMRRSVMKVAAPAMKSASSKKNAATQTSSAKGLPLLGVHGYRTINCSAVARIFCKTKSFARILQSGVSWAQISNVLCSTTNFFVATRRSGAHTCSIHCSHQVKSEEGHQSFHEATMPMLCLNKAYAATTPPSQQGAQQAALWPRPEQAQQL